MTELLLGHTVGANSCAPLASSVVGVRLFLAAAAQLEPAGQAVCDSPAVPAVGYRRPPDQGASEVHKRRALAARQ